MKLIITHLMAPAATAFSVILVAVFLASFQSAQAIVGNGCTAMAQCPSTAQSNGPQTYRYTGVDVYQREQGSGVVTTFARKPNCNLRPGQCLVTVRDGDGNTVKTYLSTGLDADAPKASPIQQDVTARSSVPYTPIDSSRLPSVAQEDTILYSPTRMFDEFYDSYTNYDATLFQNQTPRSLQGNTYQMIYEEFAQPAPEIVKERIREPEVISVDHLSSDTFRLEASDNPEVGEGISKKTDPGSTFVAPDNIQQIGDGIDVETEEGTPEEESRAATVLREIANKYAEAGAVREIPAIDDGSWVNDKRTPLIHEEVRGNLVRANGDLEYLRQLDHNNLCIAQCLAQVVSRENQLRILTALDDQMTRGYTQVIPLQTVIGNVPEHLDTTGATRYLVTLEDARGETFYCTASGTCTPSDTFVPAAPRQHPIALAAAPIEIEQVALHQSYSGGTFAYAFAQLTGNGTSVFQQLISPSPAFSPRPEYPACSLLTSLIGSCVNWL